MAVVHAVGGAGAYGSVYLPDQQTLKDHLRLGQGWHRLAIGASGSSGVTSPGSWATILSYSSGTAWLNALKTATANAVRRQVNPCALADPAHELVGIKALRFPRAVCSQGPTSAGPPLRSHRLR